MLKLLRNRNVILVLTLLTGLVAGQGAHHCEPAILPALGLVMILSVLGVPRGIFRTPQVLAGPTLMAVGANFLLLGGLQLDVSRSMIHQPAVAAGGNGIGNLSSEMDDPTGLVKNWAATEDYVLFVNEITHSNSATFTTPGNKTGKFATGKDLMAYCGADGMKYSTGQSATYGSGVTVATLNDALLTSNLQDVFVAATRNGPAPASLGGVVASDFGAPGQATLIKALSAIGSSEKLLVIPAGTWSIRSDITIPGNVCVYFGRGAVFDIADGVTVTMAGTVSAGLYKIFSWTGDGKVKFDKDSRQRDFYPEWWGAVGDEVTDDLPALNACFESMLYTEVRQNSGSPDPRAMRAGIMHLSKWYAISSTFSLNKFDRNLSIGKTFMLQGVGRRSCGFIALASCDNKPVVEAIGAGRVYMRDFGIAGITYWTKGGWTGPAPSVGLLLARHDDYFTSSGGRFEDLCFMGYYRFGLIYNAGYEAAVFRNIEAFAGCVNTNEWMFCVAFINPAYNSSNPFYGVIVGTNAEISIKSNGSPVYCTMQDCLFETWWNHSWKKAGNAGIYGHGILPRIKRVWFGGNCDYYVHGYKVQQGVEIEDMTTGDGGWAKKAAVYLEGDGSDIPRAQISNISAVKPNGTALLVKGGRLYNSTVKSIYGGNAFKIILENGAFNCRFENLYTCTQIKVISECNNNYFEIPRYCSTVDLATSSRANNQIVDGREFAGYIYMGQNNYGASVAIDTVNGMVVSNGRKIAYGSTIPTSGSWTKGDVIYNTNAAAGQPVGWICVLSNTFGTLNNGNTIGTIYPGSTRLNLNSVSGLRIGDWIDIATLNGGPYRVDNISMHPRYPGSYDSIEEIAEISAGNPTIVTLPNHSLQSNCVVYFSGITQSDWTDLNGDIATATNGFKITKIDNNTFSINKNTKGRRAYNPDTDPGVISWIFAILDHAVSATAEGKAVSFHNEVNTNAFKSMGKISF